MGMVLLPVQGLSREVETLTSLSSQLEPEVAEAVLENGVGAVVEGQCVATLTDPDVVLHGSQVLGQILWQLLVCCSVVPGHGKIF
jgi:hypothetical protein